MGAKQSQDSPTTSELPQPVAISSRGPVADTSSLTTREEEANSGFLPSLFSSFLSNSSASSSQEPGYAHGDGHDPRRHEEEVPTLPVHPFFHGHVYNSEVASEHPRHYSSGHQDRPRQQRHHQDGSSHRRLHQDRSQHRQHRRDRERGHAHERQGLERRAHRYVYRNMDSSDQDPLGSELDFSLASLNERLRALQLRQESEANGGSSSITGGVSGSNDRHPVRSHATGSRSGSRQMSASAGSLFFMRPSVRSELLLWFLY